jgi:hypothetical protein
LGLLDLFGLFNLLGFFGSARILKIWIRGQAHGRAQRYLVGRKKMFSKKCFPKANIFLKNFGDGGRKGFI